MGVRVITVPTSNKDALNTGDFLQIKFLRLQWVALKKAVSENAKCSMTKCSMFFLTQLHFSIFGLSDLHFSPYQIVDLATLCLSRLVRYSLFTTSEMKHAAWLMLFDPITFFDFRRIRSSLFTMSNCWLGYTVPFSARPIFTFHHVKMQNAA